MAYISPVTKDKSLNYDAFFKTLFDQEIDMPAWEEVDFELDLMVSDAKRLLPDLMIIGPSRIIFHVEAFTDPSNEIFELKKTCTRYCRRRSSYQY